MVRVSTFDSKEESADNVKRKDEEDATQEVVSPSLQYLTQLNKPKETTDGSMSSKLNDMFMFPQDDHLALTSEPSCRESCVKLPPQPDTNWQNKKQELALSKSLDLHRISLEKGCKLLETKPLKSSLRRNRSAECLLPKEVHFPEDIRNIRKIYKYDSLDDIIFLKKDADKSEEEASTKTVECPHETI